MGPEPRAEIPLPNGRLDLENGEVRFDTGECLVISGRERALLAYFASHPGRIISREELLLHVWEMNPQFIITRTVDMHVAKLREKLQDDAEHPVLLHTVRGQGYRWGPAMAPTPATRALAR